MKGAKWLLPSFKKNPTFRLLDRIPCLKNLILSAQEESQFPPKKEAFFEIFRKKFRKFFRKNRKKEENLPLYAPIFRQLCLKNTKNEEKGEIFPFKKESL